MAMLAGPLALSGLRALGVDDRAAKLGFRAAKAALPVAKSLFRASFGKKKNIRQVLAKAAPEIQRMVPGLQDAQDRNSLFDQVSKINEHPTGVDGSLMKKVAEAEAEKSES